MATGSGISLGGAGASSRSGTSASPSSRSSGNRSASLIKELGALVWNGDRDGPVGQLGNAQVMLFDDEDISRLE